MALPGSYIALITQELGIRQPGEDPTDQSTTKLFKLDHPKPAHLPCPFIPEKSTVKAFPPVPLALSSFCLLPPQGSLVWPCMVCPSLSGTVSDKLSFPWQSSPDWLPSLYLNKTTTSTFKTEYSFWKDYHLPDKKDCAQLACTFCPLPFLTSCVSVTPQVT